MVLLMLLMVLLLLLLLLSPSLLIHLCFNKTKCCLFCLRSFLPSLFLSFLQCFPPVLSFHSVFLVCSVFLSIGSAFLFACLFVFFLFVADRIMLFIAMMLLKKQLRCQSAPVVITGSSHKGQVLVTSQHSLEPRKC